MKFRIFFALSFILLIALNDAYSSTADSAKQEIKIPTLIKYIYGDAFSIPQLSYHSLDTSLDYLQRVNPALIRHYNYLANSGSAVSSQIFSQQKELFTDAGIHPYDLYLFEESKIRYFKTNKAFTEINYHLAGGKEQQLNVALSENISKNWNAGIDFNRLGSNGFLKNGTTFHSNVDLYTWFHTENNRYNLLAFAYWNVIENKVNGGLHSDSIYDNSSVSNFALQGLLVNLDDAAHHFRNHKFSLKQFYDLGFNTEEKINDSTTKFHFKPSARIEHSISLEARSFTYLDNVSGSYYRNSFFSSASLDSLHYYDLRNRISFTSLENKKKSSDSIRTINYCVALEHQWMRYEQISSSDLQFVDTIIQNASVIACLKSREEKNKLFWKASGEYVFAGANNKDYKGDISVSTPLNNFGSVNLAGLIMLKSPDFVYQRYYSNHFIWENDFAKSSVKNFSAEYSYPKFKLSIGAEITSTSNFIYLDSTASPVQSQNEIQVLKYFLNKDFRFGKFHFNNSFIIQKVNHENELHLPQLISTQSLFYESFLFKSALLLRVGFDFHYHSSYYADAFMPATGLFYLQNEKKTGGFGLTDFFINFRIKTARMFLKFENIGDNFLAKGYYLTPHYPMQGMTVQFGICWRFFDQ